MKQPIFAGDSIAMRVIYQYIDQNNLNIKFEETTPNQNYFIGIFHCQCTRMEWQGKLEWPR